VLRDSLAAECGLPAGFDQNKFAPARGVSSAYNQPARRHSTNSRRPTAPMAEDLNGNLVYLARSPSYLYYMRERAPGIVFTDVKAST
jgi:peptide chain release factor 3